MRGRSNGNGGDRAERIAMQHKRRVLHDHDELHEGDGIDDYHEWVATYNRETRQPFERTRDRIGREGNGGYSTWQVWQCNNPNCKAEAIVSVEAIEQEVIQWLKH
jgi:hypothetical protein